MSHIALYRLWRPQAFRDIVGQEHIIQTLHNALREERINHAYLFCGPRGTGKTTAARIMAKALNCEHGPATEPCNECPACERITNGSMMDVIEIDAASNRRVEETRNLLEQVRYAPTEGRYKVYIIDEVHMLTTEAFNTLLKTLEEPPAHVIFILATTDPNRLPATIISRCQRFDFRRVDITSQLSRLSYICEQENIDIEPDALALIARLSHGGMRDALSLLDQIISYANDKITYEQVIAVTGGIDSEQFKQLAKAIHSKDVGRCLAIIAELISSGKSVDRTMESLIQYYRDLLLIKLVPHSDQVTERMLNVDDFAELAEQYDQSQMFAAIDILNHYYVEMKYASQPQTLLEIAVLKLCTLDEQSVSHTSSGASGGSAGGGGARGRGARGGTAPQSQASTSAAQAPSSAEWRKLVAQVAALESEIAALKRTGISGVTAAPGASGVTVAPAAPGVSGAPGASGVTADSTNSSGSGVSGDPSVSQGGAGPLSSPSEAIDSHAPDNVIPSSAASPTQSSRTTERSAALAMNVDEQRKAFLQGRSGEAFKAVVTKWSQVLNEVKNEKITVHAWLVNGEPVAVHDDGVLVAFKNEIHCKTTEKPDNKKLIEQVMQRVFGKELKLHTMMANDWNAMLPSDDQQPEPAQAEPEPFQLEPETEAEGDGKHKEPWINEAIELFGEDLVTIKEDD